VWKRFGQLAMTPVVGIPTLRRFLLVSLLLAACGRDEAARARVLTGILAREERVAAARDPEAVHEKWQRMSRDAFAYFRGSAAVFERDLAGRDELLAGGGTVALVGDPHPENVGAFLWGDEWSLEWNDFDRARYGRASDDVLRLGVGFWVASEIAGLGRSRRERVVRKVARGWADEIAALAAGRPPVEIRPGKGFGRIAMDLIAEAKRTVRSSPSVARGATIADADAARVRALLAAWARSRGEEPPEAVGMERTKSGVASRALERWRVRVEGPSPDASDDFVLEVKETRNSHPDRVVEAEREVQRRVFDPWLGLAQDGRRAFLIRSIPPWRETADVERIAARVRTRVWRYRDLRTFAHETGRLLARAHALSHAPAAPAPVGALARAVGDGRSFVAAVAGRCDEEGARTLADFRTFRELVRTGRLR
jgi:hypothetical protein